ncbi:hypothetical protein KP509_04G072000 [Ceratopteris richardii]|uniref:TFIIS central domain-containing protein n=1 Tax=Ceratopteris richardii TaxID=49495 RepID=A0A8T2UY10_CERRI|nr:hypothetical protein KP509_04G072000 [Ceratopteris richardii]
MERKTRQRSAKSTTAPAPPTSVRRSSRGAAVPVASTPIRRSARHAVEKSESHEMEEPDIDATEEPERPAVEEPEKLKKVTFAPSDPYSTAMDDMPLKDLFPNMKVRKRPQKKKAKISEISASKNIENEDSFRINFRESLAAALEKIKNTEWKQEWGQNSISETMKAEQVLWNNKSKEQSMASLQGFDGASLKIMSKTEAVADKAESVEVMSNPTKEEDSDLSNFEEAPSKRIKLAVTDSMLIDNNIDCKTSDLVSRVAIDIEAEMYKHFGGVNEEYKEKTCSLLFNLKDRPNPIFGLQILTSKFTPDKLCCMDVEHLASEGLLEWKRGKMESVRMIVPAEMNADETSLVDKSAELEIESGLEKGVLTDMSASDSKQRFDKESNLTDTMACDSEHRSEQDILNEIAASDSGKGSEKEDDLTDVVASCPEQILEKECASVDAEASCLEQRLEEESVHNDVMASVPEQTFGDDQVGINAEEFSSKQRVEKEELHSDVMPSVSEQNFVAPKKQQETAEVIGNVRSETPNGNTQTLIKAVEVEKNVPSSSPVSESNLTEGIVAVPNHMQDPITETPKKLDPPLEKEEEKSCLPAILSLDEFVGSKKVRGSKTSVKGDDLDLKLGLNEVKPPANLTQIDKLNTPAMNVKEKFPRKPSASPNHKTFDSGSSKNGTGIQKDRKKEHKLNEKLWKGSFQLSGSQISPVVALFKSGDRVELQNWPKLIEIKGRVRLDALEKFVQELRLSRTRAVMVIACRIDGGEGTAAANAMKEAANQYQRGERVGYAEPIPGYELYLFPGGGGSLKLLVEHGYLNVDQVSSAENGILIGFVVCRRSPAPLTNVSYKSSSNYFAANRHAISAQLDSPTRPNEIQSLGTVIKTNTVSSLPPKETECSSASLSALNLQGVLAPTSANESKGKSATQQEQRPADLSLSSRSDKIGATWSSKGLVKDEDGIGDLPPGFGPKGWTGPRQSILDDDDDLPEYDFSDHKPSSILSRISNSDVATVPPFSMQASHAHGPIFLSSQGLAPPSSYEQLNSQFTRPIFSPAVEHVPSLSQASQPLHFLPLGACPPSGPPSGPPHLVMPLPRPQLPSNSIFPARMPVTNVLNGEGFFHQPPQPKTGIPQIHDDQRTKVAAPLLQNQSIPVSQTSSGPLERIAGTKGSSLWDDDDMPEWCPPTFSQQPDNTQLPSSSTRQSADTSLGSVPQVLPPAVSGGWQGTKTQASLTLQGEGRGILQSPPTLLRYPVPGGGNHYPIGRQEKFSAAANNRSNELRGFKSSK